MTPVFARVLGAEFDRLPAPVPALHVVLDERHWQGMATVTRGRSLVARIACACVGFPASATSVPVTVSMRLADGEERWERNFAGRRFRSVPSPAGPAGSGLIHERFGPLRCEIGLSRDGGRLLYPVARAWLFGIPVPRRLLPTSETAESAADGIVRFDVRISLPLCGPIIHYAGWPEDTRLRMPPSSTASTKAPPPPTRG